MTTTRNRPARPGFTLIEILVVMSLIILLAALALGISQTGMFGSQKVISGGDRASGWLLIAKQRAMRDGQPRGVRFFNTAGGVTGNVNAFTEAAYIEVPDAWVPNPAQEGNPGGARLVFVYTWAAGVAPAPNTVNAREVYFVGAAADLAEYDQRVSANDTLVLPEFGASFKIQNPNSGGSNIPSNTYGSTPSAATQLSSTNARRVELVALPPDLSAAGTVSTAPQRLPTMVSYKFGFQRPAQPLLGEPALQMTAGVSIDFRFPISAATLGAAVEPPLPSPGGYRTWSAPTPAVAGVPNAGPFNPPTTIGVMAQPDPATAGGSFFDILFSPSGQVLNNNAGIVCLWVRETAKVPHPRQTDTAGRTDCDTVLANDLAGAQILIVLNTRNGLISTQQILPPPAAPATGYDPYSTAKDGINSGL